MVWRIWGQNEEYESLTHLTGDISHLWGSQLLRSGQQAPFHAMFSTVLNSGHGRVATNA